MAKSSKIETRAIKEIEYSPVIPCLAVQEALILRANELGLTVNPKHVSRKRKRKEVTTYANCVWFYSDVKKMRKESKTFKAAKKKLVASRKLLVSAHQTSAMKMRRPNEMFEVEYISDHRIIKGQRYYLIKWVGWPEEANTWESVVNLSCHCLIKEFHEDLNQQLEKYFVEKNLSWNKILLGANGFHKATYTQRLFDMIPKQFRYQSTYGDKKVEFRKKLKEWQDIVNLASRGHPNIAVENEVDLELPPHNFVYIAENIPGKGVSIPDDPLIGCECTNVCSSASGHCSCSTNGYQLQRPLYCDGLIKLRPGKPIYECNSRCKCSINCPNRVVQKGSKYTLAIFRTPNGKGWGVKALQPIPRGAFVIEYVGEVITNLEAEKRGKEYDSEGTTYLFDLDYHETENPMTVDATRFGNVSHFINHSCAPNLQVFNVFIDNMDLALPRIALFARKNINVNDELTFDYQMTGATEDTVVEEVDDVSETDSDSDESKTSSILRKKCLCNAPNCRGWLVI